MPGRRRVAMVSLAAVIAGTVAVTLTVYTGGSEHALSLDASAVQHVANSAARAAPGGAAASPDMVGSPQRASIPSAAPRSSPAVATPDSATPAPAPSLGAAETAASTIKAPPAKPPAEVCGNKSRLTGPAKQPKGSVRVPAGNNGYFNFGRVRTTYWFAPGLHTMGNAEYDNITPAYGDVFIGAPGAILDGKHIQDSAFDDTSTHITISYLTIRNFGTWGGDQQEGVVNHDSGSYWTITHDTIIDNAGAGVMLGSDDTLSWNCIESNQQYGFNAYSNNGTIHNLVLDHNEIADNDTYNYEVRYGGCGCSGGGKFWNVINAVVTNNWVVNNKSVGLWADTDNAGFEFVGNYIQNSQNIGLQYEISYNAVIEYNTFNHNGVGDGPSSGSSFPTSAIYISESGSDSRVHTNYAKQFLIAHNDFLNNWGGVVLWENSNRFCASPDNSSNGYCTMVDPKANLQTCGTPADIAKQPYLSDCRWKTQNVLVEDNLFKFTPSGVGSGCSFALDCGFNGVFSEYGSDPSWSPYQGDVVPTNITYHQNNHFLANTYVGPWCFMGWQLGTSVGWNQWRAAPHANNIGQPNQTFGQDAKSKHTGASWSCS
jgi:Right handed beta helix region